MTLHFCIANDTITLLKNVYATKIRSDNMEIKRDSYLEQLKKKILLENGVDEDHIIEIALDGIESEE